MEYTEAETENLKRNAEVLHIPLQYNIRYLVRHFRGINIFLIKVPQWYLKQLTSLDRSDFID